MSEPTTTIVEQLLNTTPEVKVEEHLTQLVGEGKKYANVDALAKAYLNADEHIKKILEEKRQVELERDSLKTHNKTIDDLLAVIDAPRTITEPKPEGNAVDIDKLVTETLLRREQELTQKKRVEEAKAALLKDFEGEEKLREAISNYTKGDKTKVAILDQLVLADYAAAVSILKAAVPQPQNTDFGNGPSQQLTSVAPQSGLTWSKCEEIRKKEPKLYNSREFQVAMHKAASINPNFMKE